MILRGSYSWPWENLTEQQQTTRLDEVLDPETTGRFYYVTARDSYRVRGCVEESPDWCPAEAVEQRRKWLDGLKERERVSRP